MIEIIRANFTAGEVKTFLIQGEYVEILECAYPIDVAMMDRSGAQLSTMRSAESSYFSRPGKYEVIQVTSSAAQTVRLFVGSGDAGTRRTSGDVSVVDGEKNRTLSGGMYAGAVYSGAATAGSYPYTQLWNPIGSGKNLILLQTSFSLNIGSSLDLFGSNVMLGNSVSTANKKLGVSVSTGQVRREQKPAVDPVNMGTVWTGYLSANSIQTFLPKGSIVIEPGIGMTLRGPLNSSNTQNFEWFEEVI